MTELDMTETIAPKSDQLNADDLLSGERTFTIASVSKGNAEQPIAVRLVEFGDGRPYYPCKSMRRVMVAAWGKDGNEYVGHRLTLYRDPEVLWGGQAVGGIRIRAMSHIKKPLSFALTLTRGKRAPYKVQPLADAPVTIDAAEQKRLSDTIRAAGMSTRTAALGFMASIIGHSVASSAELTPDEAAKISEAAQGQIRLNEVEDAAGEGAHDSEPDPTDNGEMPNGGVQ